jgi:hypothetical protein
MPIVLYIVGTKKCIKKDKRTNRKGTNMLNKELAHVKVDHNDGVTILTTNGHYGEYPVPQIGVNTYVVHDGYKTSQIIDYLGLLPEQSDPPTIEAHQAISKVEERLITKAMVAAIKAHDFDFEALKKEKHLDDIDYCHTTVLKFYGTEKNHNSNCEHWADLCVQYAESVGGDDSYFDYFPSFYFCFMEYCIALGRINLLEATTERVRVLYKAHTDAWEPGLIPKIDRSRFTNG